MRKRPHVFLRKPFFLHKRFWKRSGTIENDIASSQHHWVSPCQHRCADILEVTPSRWLMTNTWLTSWPIELSLDRASQTRRPFVLGTPWNPHFRWLQMQYALWTFLPKLFCRKREATNRSVCFCNNGKSTCYVHMCLKSDHGLNKIINYINGKTFIGSLLCF